GVDSAAPFTPLHSSDALETAIDLAARYRKPVSPWQPGGIDSHVTGNRSDVHADRLFGSALDAHRDQRQRTPWHVECLPARYYRGTAPTHCGDARQAAWTRETAGIARY